MLYSSEILNNRTTGASELSIGTHLALESLFFDKLKLYDDTREFKKLKIQDYSYHVFNIFTIIRNILNACEEKDKLSILTDKEFPDLLRDEVGIINSYYVGSGCTPYLFYPDYSSVIDKLNKDKLPTMTEPMKQLVDISNTVADLKKRNLISENNTVGEKQKRNHILPVLKGKVLITTHCYVDLFNKNDLYLLESHTGTIKGKKEWNTKYHSIGNNDLSHLPFNQHLYYILGDYNLVTPLNLLLRRQVLDLSRKMKWNTLTTRLKIQIDLMRIPDVYKIINKIRLPY